jgi:predicted Zn finger-like uncharacterized protein
MAATDPIKITCPECKKVIAVPPDLLGKKVRCKGCSKVFEAQKLLSDSITFPQQLKSNFGKQICIVFV